MPVGRTQYADISGWDVYRTQIPLLAMLMPRRAERHRRLDARRRRAERLPAALVLRQRPEHDDGRRPADPIIASAAAFGASGFDADAALAAMVKGANEGCRSRRRQLRPAPGPRAVQSARLRAVRSRRQAPQRELAVRRPRRRLGLGGDHARVRDADFSIAQFAGRALGDRAMYRSFISRSGNWRNLLNPSSGLIEPRFEDGAFAPRYDNLRGAGFAEGDSVQYTWMVPHDPAGLFVALAARERRGPARPLSCARSTAAPAPRTPTTRCWATSPT
jgi:putative alpha-1,2-mannosidase